jgi:endonuclease YncB( thermonuclease family)
MGCGVQGENYQAPPQNNLVAASCLTQPYAVNRVIDGDTLQINLVDATGQVTPTKVRLQGIDTPEIYHGSDSAPSEPCGEAAKLYTTTTVGTQVELQFTSSCSQDPLTTCRDTHGRILAYVKLADCSDLGARLLNIGLARVYEIADFDRKSSYQGLEQSANSQQLGVHGDGCQN